MEPLIFYNLKYITSTNALLSYVYRMNGMPTYNHLPAFPPANPQGLQVNPAANQIFYLTDEESLEYRLHFGQAPKNQQEERWRQQCVETLTTVLIGTNVRPGINPLCRAHKTMGEQLRGAREEARLNGRPFYGVICEPQRPAEERTLEGRRHALPTSDKEVQVVYFKFSNGNIAS